MTQSSTTLSPESRTKTQPAGAAIDAVQHAIEHARHYLPAQGPISIFVHHNTLHAFEDLPFEEAVLEGGRIFGCEPYLTEQHYREELRRGRIAMDDLREVLMDDLGDGADELIASFGTRYTLRLAMLQMALHHVPDAELQWMLAETKMLQRFRTEISPQRREKMIALTRSWVMRHQDKVHQADRADQTAKTDDGTEFSLPAAIQSTIGESGRSRFHQWNDAEWESFALRALWDSCRYGVQLVNVPASTMADPTAFKVKLNDALLAVHGENMDRTVNEILIRFCGGFLDQGFSDWTLPDRDQGFAKAFARLYLGRMMMKPTWMKGLNETLRHVARNDFDPLASIVESLNTFGVGPDQVDDFVRDTLLALRGWAGMIWQMESNTPFLPHPIPKGSLNEYLAIRLLLMRHAVADLGRRRMATSDVSEVRDQTERRYQAESHFSVDERTHTVFQLAQVGGWTPEQLTGMSAVQWQCLLTEIEQFGSLDRRRLLHRAYERHYAVEALDAIAIHSKRRREKHAEATPEIPPAYVAVFCIDDREESFRRHLEEVDPACRTASAAGFFAVAMYYQGADHAHYRPLCPAIVTPRHYVREVPLFSSVAEGERRAIRRRRLGWFAHRVHSGSRTLIGGWFTGVFGAIATFPMVARIMAPRVTAKIRESMGTFVRPPSTELHLERTAPEPGSDVDSLGYSLDEMAAIVVRILQDIGLVRDFPPIIVFFGHGSGSLNNPHESAYNCGACSGGRGGPNARAFAVMANDPRVRRKMISLGVELPEDIRFVGAYHNTCNDHVDYYDLDLLPRSHRPLFRRIEANINETRARNAHERARRFESAALNLTPREALEHVEERAEDLSQARPEYNHATNALVTVGRRDWTRGLFMDRRVFLTEYDPAVDNEDCAVLTRILQAAIPVCGGISLEYYFSAVDVEGYGCGSKLPHNIVSMIGVMTGAASDLRPGLSQQMIEIHEPMRILFVIETTPEKLNRIIAANEGIRRLVEGHWVQIAVIDPKTSSIMRYVDGRYEPHSLSSVHLPEVKSSIDWYRGQRDHLGFASIVDAANASALVSRESDSVMA